MHGKKFITTITNSETIIGVIKLITGAIEGLAWFLDKTTFIGRNLFSIMVLLIGAIKGWNIATAIAIKLGVIDNAVKSKGVIATTMAIAAKNKKKYFLQKP